MGCNYKCLRDSQFIVWHASSERCLIAVCVELITDKETKRPTMKVFGKVTNILWQI